MFMKNSSWHAWNRHVEELFFSPLIVLKIRVESGGLRARSPHICRPPKLRSLRRASTWPHVPAMAQAGIDRDTQVNRDSRCFSPKDGSRRLRTSPCTALAWWADSHTVGCETTLWQEAQPPWGRLKGSLSYGASTSPFCAWLHPTPQAVVQRKEFCCLVAV